ncbi:MAG: winged helix-turn-helix transcriptional regulator [Muribaculaceae bacterium]
MNAIKHIEEDKLVQYLSCPIRQVISKFGDKWSLLVLYTINENTEGVMRFNELRRHMSDCSQKMLSATLKNLEKYNLVHREVFAQVPPKVEYSLTETGRSLMPALHYLIKWAKSHIDDVNRTH